MMYRPRKRRWGNELVRSRAKRRADFARRVRSYEENDADVYRVEGGPWVYLPVHPMADEAALLEKLGITPSDCSHVHAYWRTEQDAYFVQVNTATEYGRPVPVGFSASWWHDDPPRLHLTAIVDAPYVTRALFEAALARFASLDLAIPVGQGRRWPGCVP
jgi:hypothetical protein